jgi:phosphohistidine phosphatase SixA
MDVDKIWQEEDWTSDARTIIDNLNKFPEDSKIILVLRHSHRLEPEINEKLHKVRLTPKGHAIAKKFGENLPKNRAIRLFHSIIWRCEETAENIHNGFKRIGGKSEIIGELDLLYKMGFDDDEQTRKKFYNHIMKYSFRKAMLRWVTGFYLPEEWTPFIRYIQNAANLIWNKLSDAPERGIDIYVTHDWHVMTLRFGWFALLPDKRWVNYHGGFAFTFEDDHILLLDYGELKRMEFPHWWKNGNYV